MSLDYSKKILIIKLFLDRLTCGAISRTGRIIHQIGIICG